MVRCWRSGLLLAAPGEVIEDGWVAHEGGRVLDIGTGDPPTRPEIDRPGSALAAAFVNAHSHLELTHLGGRLPRGVGLPEWLDRLVPLRRRLHGRFRLSVAAGFRRCVAGGFGVIGDIESTGAAWGHAAGLGTAGVCFQEVIGGYALAADGRVESARRALRARPANALWRTGLSPHSPYTVASAVLSQLAALAHSRGMRMAVHAAEDPSEEELLRHGTGPMAAFLDRVGAQPSDWTPPGVGPIEVLDRTGCLGPNTTVIHANYPAKGDVERLAGSGSTVVYCPGSHAFFAHQPYPLEAYLQAGVPVALGTDSLASNDDLSALAEMSRVRRRHPAVPAVDVFRMATEAGARALGRGTGRIEAGQPADAVWLEWSGSDDPWESVTRGAWAIQSTAVGGRVVGTAANLP